MLGSPADAYVEFENDKQSFPADGVRLLRSPMYPSKILTLANLERHYLLPAA